MKRAFIGFLVVAAAGLAYAQQVTPSVIGRSTQLGRADGGTLPVPCIGCVIADTVHGPLYSDGGAWVQLVTTPVGTPVGSTWTIALNCNLANEADQTITGDGGFTACGTSCWDRQQSSGGTVALVNGSGLQITPAQSTALGGGNISAPRVHLQLQCLIPSLTPETPVRITARGYGNMAANFDQNPFGFWAYNGNAFYSFWATRNTFNAGLKLTARRTTWSFDSNEVVPPSGGEIGTPNTFRWVAPLGLGNDTAFFTTVVMDAGTLPVPESNFVPFSALSALSFTNGPNPNTTVEGMAGWDAFLSCIRNNSATTLVCKWTDLTVEYKP